MNEFPKRWRLVIDSPSTGAENMARDEAMALCADGDVPGTLRAYRFSPPAVTIGRFQDFPGTIDLEECRRGNIDVVRRPTGGLAILHLNDFTYSVVTGASAPGRGDAERVFNLVACAITASLEKLGIVAERVSHQRAGRRCGDWCFDSAFGVDLESNGRKICGSAQRLVGASVLQHGSLFLLPADDSLRSISAGPYVTGDGASPFVTLLEAAGRPITWEETLEAFRLGFESSLGVVLAPGTLTDREESLARRLVETKFSKQDWLRRQRRSGHVQAL